MNRFIKIKRTKDKMTVTHKIRLADVAREAGVSSSLASMVINKSNGKNMRVGEETAARIVAAAKKLNYSPNAAAKSLATSRSRCIGYIMSDSFVNPWKNEYYTAYLNGAARACQQYGYGMMLGCCNLQNAVDFAIPEKIKQRSVDALIVIGGIAPDLWEIYNRYEFPTVLLDYMPESETPPYAYIVNERWEYAAIDYALECGHRNIGICLNAYSRNYELIYKNLRSRCDVIKKQYGGNISIYRPPDNYPSWEPEHGDALYNMWVSTHHQEKTSFIIGGHCMIGYLKNVFFPRGVSVPEQLSVVVGPDSVICPYFSPPLTAFDHDRDAQGAIAVKMLIDHLDRGIALTRHHPMPEARLKLIERQSVKKIPI
jgi:DNA-binding LacI/PurR family transcriptional regulator